MNPSYSPFKKIPDYRVFFIISSRVQRFIRIESMHGFFRLLVRSRSLVTYQ